MRRKDSFGMNDADLTITRICYVLDERLACDTVGDGWKSNGHGHWTNIPWLAHASRHLQEEEEDDSP